MEQKEWLTIREAAEYLGISYGRMTTKVRKGVYPVSRVPGFKGVVRISRTRLDQMMMDNEKVAVTGTEDDGSERT